MKKILAVFLFLAAAVFLFADEVYISADESFVINSQDSSLKNCYEFMEVRDYSNGTRMVIEIFFPKNSSNVTYQKQHFEGWNTIPKIMITVRNRNVGVRRYTMDTAKDYFSQIFFTVRNNDGQNMDIDYRIDLNGIPGVEQSIDSNGTFSYVIDGDVSGCLRYNYNYTWDSELEGTTNTGIHIATPEKSDPYMREKPKNALECVKCMGTGTCRFCKGRGTVGIDYDPCPECRGSGKCDRCDGKGYTDF